jgi:endonuclease/exonuclease/phosphatase (EEP) superfamily protein YafD
MKKFFILAAALAVIGLTAAPELRAQDMKKLEALEKELEQLEAKVDRGQQLTPREIQRMQEIQQEAMQEAMKAAGPYGGLLQQSQNQKPAQGMTVEEIERQQQQTLQFQQMMQQSEQQQQQQQREARMYPGETRGWPGANIFSQCSLPNLRQPAGATASYTYNSQSRELTVYITNGTQNTVDELGRAIDASGKATYKDLSSGYFVLPMPQGLGGASRNAHYQVLVTLEDGVVKLNAGRRAG